MLQNALRLPAMPLDAVAQRPLVWVAVLSGASLGLVWGVAARIWMRLIATEPEFSISGTAIIFVITTLFGACTGFAFAARRRGWRRWGHYGPRVLAVVCFIPLGLGGGMILMVTVLLATIAMTQKPLVGVWAVALLMVPLAALVGIGGGGIEIVFGTLVLLFAIALTALKGLARRSAETSPMRMVTSRLERTVRPMLLLLAAGGVGFVAWQIAAEKPGWFALLYILLYLLLLYPAFLALRVALEPKLPQADPMP